LSAIRKSKGGWPYTSLLSVKVATSAEVVIAQLVVVSSRTR
jgi:hypothetical protein